eukprot:GILI01012715.1.p1 GENE.GILI01012715.1~~GILI01012715.1.p1  ORF type:complete len:269 (+),score=50.61 GILI01012715.1:52-858(+)
MKLRFLLIALLLAIVVLSVVEARSATGGADDEEDVDFGFEQWNLLKSRNQKHLRKQKDRRDQFDRPDRRNPLSKWSKIPHQVLREIKRNAVTEDDPFDFNAVKQATYEDELLRRDDSDDTTWQTERVLYMLAHENKGPNRHGVPVLSALARDEEQLAEWIAATKDCDTAVASEEKYLTACLKYQQILLSQLSQVSGQWYFAECKYKHYGFDDLYCFARVGKINYNARLADVAQKISVLLVFDKATGQFRLSWEGYPDAFTRISLGGPF